MPELPDLTIYLEALEERVVGTRLERIRLKSAFLVRTVDPPVSEFSGRLLHGVRRLGKRLVFAFDDDLFLILHLMISGRLQWKPLPASGERPGLGPKTLLATLDFAAGTLLLTEAASKKRASVYLVRGEAAVAAHDPGGIEPLTSDVAAFRTALSRENRTLKRALTDPRWIAGVGNAYSDEILHTAKLSPFQRTGNLDDSEWARLHAATQSCLVHWTRLLRDHFRGRFPDKVTAFRPEMAVHGKYREPCPVCGRPIQRVLYAENECDYCPICQTGGHLLADRALSQLMKDDWPRTLEELEEKKAQAAATISQ